ncbi:D-alanyl-lipoteichoic acid acyltransferase DltB, MBOAT superfamily [Reichenbachiella agariperforans]|uniref:D-alanyl-lipoteichoic acid acyltransferase DltB, MBOAT superfamily n=1 Tax=Reichenbachiella agariperforans TaxID=156994 RepID=A0A1M6W4D0_REIAG|nr:MBOAT family O-acyltransferase [Reichenbachiella agariperforans]SHK88567.1 D-alanyl-lipoteichoic acid acyltransferase DltB, MBOAT superfamily [Reichenbachiella agariperforans]
MLFNSYSFILFFLIVFTSYWVIFKNSLKYQNTLIVIASYIFYGWWDWRFLFLIAFSSILDYFIAIGIHNSKSDSNKKLFLFTSLFVNLGLLGFFKYYNFFIDSFSTALTTLGFQSNVTSLNIILPVGISFYTFQTLSYSIDVYRDKLKPTPNFIAFLAYVSFFPQLVAGPIERATHLLPQFLKERRFNYNASIDGLKQALWGFFKKMVIADNCAEFANLIFNNHQDYQGWALTLGAIFFAFQIYCDFSGYSDIAIGTAKLLGFDLMTNFKYPYFSRNIGEFWRRWHISLSTWFRDYLYIPLGGSQMGTLLSIRNIFIIFIVSGLWHGANWTFVAWGALNAFYFLPSFLSKQNRKHLNTNAQLKELPAMLFTFLLVTTAWILFRAESLTEALSIYQNIIISIPDFTSMKQAGALMFYEANYTLALLTLFMIIEWHGRRNPYPIKTTFAKKSVFVRMSFYAFLISLIGIYFVAEGTPFIYFQF